MNGLPAAPGRRFMYVVLALLAIVIGGAVVILVVVHTGPQREAIQVYTRLVFAAESGNVDAAKALCTRRYVREHGVTLAASGGLVGLPRTIHKNFQAWREGPEVWFCPTNRMGPVYRFREEGGSWRFDGLVGLLEPGGVIVTSDERAP